jgi:hypothetical protein
MSGRISLSWLEYDVLWEHLRLGVFRPVLSVPSPGRTEEERAELRAKVWASLAAKGVDKDDDRLVRMVTRLANPEWELDARMQLTQTGPRTTVLIARAGRHATVAVLNDDELRLWSAKADDVIAEASYLMPIHPAGTGGSITLPTTALDQAAAKAGSDPDRFTRALAGQGMGKSDARKVTAVLGNVIRLAHFGAAHTPPGEPRRRASHVVSVYDNPEGRYLFTRKKDWVTLVPGTEAALARQLSELLSSLTEKR